MINVKDLPTLVPHNVNWSSFFRNDYPVDLEIGCGRPHFLFERALNFLDRNIVGIEWKYEFVEQAHRRITREGIQNAAAFHGNAWMLVPMLFSESSIAQVFINFPDPWWKTRHKKRLVLNDIFLTALQERVKPNGSILVQTDVFELFQYYLELFEHHGGFHFDKDQNEQMLINSTKAKTHREKKCLEQGLTIYRGLFRR